MKIRLEFDVFIDIRMDGKWEVLGPLGGFKVWGKGCNK